MLINKYMDKKGDWWTGRRYTLRHKFRLWLGIWGQYPDGEYIYKYGTKYNKIIHRLVNLIPKI